VRAIEAGCDDFLPKPYEQDALLTRIRSLLRIKNLTDELEDAEAILMTLVRTIEAKDRYTLGHADRVGRYAVMLGRALGCNAFELESLRKGGMLHDIGKLGIPDAILQKAGPLDDTEWEIMRKHAVVGGEICKRLKSLENILPLIIHHHECLDGTGYPSGFKAPRFPNWFASSTWWTSTTRSRPAAVTKRLIRSKRRFRPCGKRWNGAGGTATS
jgi:putative two-component system response regulator